MAKINNPLLKSKEDKQVSYQIKLRKSVKNDLDELKKRIEKEAPDLSLNVSQTVEEYLVTLIKSANKTLDGLPKRDEGSNSSEIETQGSASPAPQY